MYKYILGIAIHHNACSAAIRKVEEYGAAGKSIEDLFTNGLTYGHVIWILETLSSVLGESKKHSKIAHNILVLIWASHFSRCIDGLKRSEYYEEMKHIFDAVVTRQMHKIDTGKWEKAASHFDNTPVREDVFWAPLAHFEKVGTKKARVTFEAAATAMESCVSFGGYEIRNELRQNIGKVLYNNIDKLIKVL